MDVAIVGAGAVGLNLAARLASTGTAVRLIVRREEAARRITREGIRLEDPATGRCVVARPAAVGGIESLGDDDAIPPIVLAVRVGQTSGLARTIADRLPDAVVASAQNDVDNEALLARHFASVIGMVVRQTCTRRDDRTVLATGSGRIVVGDHPGGFGDVAARLADRLEAAGFDVGRSRRIGDDKWLKLCVNGMSAVNALVRRDDHTGEAFVALKVQLLEEARAVLTAAGVTARSYDGRDRSLDEEIAFLRASVAAGTSARPLPLYNACWAALADPTRPLESDRFHARILDLAAGTGASAPTHRVVHDAVLAAYEQCRGPECHGADELLARVAQAGRR